MKLMGAMFAVSGGISYAILIDEGNGDDPARRPAARSNDRISIEAH